MTDRPRMRLVDRVVLHEGQSFEQLACRVITPRTRFLVLDLDRTVHLGHNMGELLGWEASALRAFGPDGLDRLEPTRPRGRMLFASGSPLGSLRYLAIGARSWAAPGLYYLLFGKLPANSTLLRRWTYRRFGAEPVRAVQSVPQRALLQILDRIPDEVVRGIAERVWDRHAGDQVITREGLDELRAWHPSLRIVLTSASPRQMVQVAAERLGVDHAEYSEPGRINTGPSKIARLAETLPEVLDPEIETVGITDTGYGEDRCWAHHFARVVDVNSDSPFSPLVAAESPLREIHSTDLWTRAEREAALFEGHPRPDPRRRVAPREERRVFERPELAGLLREELDEADALARDPERHAQRLDALQRRARARLGRLDHETRAEQRGTAGADLAAAPETC